MTARPYNNIKRMWPVTHMVDVRLDVGVEGEPLQALCGWTGRRIVGPSLWPLERRRCSKCLAVWQTIDR